ncbi:MAG: sigma-70 family RNA polymerase sigma factor [Firmicutes bacterium]|nr:sigma-70 family RNA polymerase sigma factor [Bacillota bacterium]MDH7495188.1 sigma-70 family RNA polymerase sigma factor [Bacillota bacterium]
MVRSIADDELVAMCLAGRREAWETLVTRYGSYVYAIAIRSFHMSADEAEEAFQAVFTKVYTSLEQYRSCDRQEAGGFKRWISRVTRSVCIDQMRAKARSGGPEIPSGQVEAWTDGHEPVDGRAASRIDDEISRLADRVTVRQALARLPEESRKLLYLRFYKDLPYNEIARLTGRSEKVAAALTSRSLARLRQVLVNMGAVT